MHASIFGGFAGVVFDAYGTLFDIDALETHCGAVVDQPRELARLWRMKQIDYAILRTVMDRYADWSQITSDALDFATTALGIDVDPNQRRVLMRGWLELPAFADVPDALTRLAAADLPLVILTNGTRQMLTPLLERSQLAEHFAAVLTSESVQAFKPDPSIYIQVTERLRARINEVLFVTANGFDVAGSKSVGFTVCRVDRRGTPLDQLGLEPDIHVQHLGELADLLLGSEHDA